LAQSLWAQEQAELERRAIPVTQVYGTLLERIVYKALLRLGVPFDFQSSLVGGRWGWQFGRQVADFVLPQQRLILEVQGNRWHRPLEMQSRDMERELILRAHGWTVLYLWEEVILDPLRLEQWLVDNVLHSAMDTTGYFASTNPALVMVEQKRVA
jgi:G:T-mismatch repair DNA endonuclease (very short patch repair protein)